MKLLTDNEINERFQQLNRPGRQIRTLADSYGSAKVPQQKAEGQLSPFVARGLKKMKTRTDRSVRIGKRITPTGK